jgi:hypothetical protein
LGDVGRADAVLLSGLVCIDGQGRAQFDGRFEKAGDSAVFARTPAGRDKEHNTASYARFGERGALLEDCVVFGEDYHACFP